MVPSRGVSDGGVSDGGVSDGGVSDGGVSDGSAPQGSVYDWYVRGLRLLESGDVSAAEQLLSRAAAEEPGSRSIREALGRARLGSRQWASARLDFSLLVEAAPDDDYARFGLGLALARLGRFESAAEQLSLAVAMRPDREDYRRYLREVRATLAARSDSRNRVG